MNAKTRRAGVLPQGSLLFLCCTLATGCSPASAEQQPDSNETATNEGSPPAETDAAAPNGTFETPMFDPAAPATSCGEGDANVLFVVDRSGSMNCNLPPITDSATCEQDPVRVDTIAPSKWEIVSDTLSSALGGLAVEGRVVRAGLSYFSQDDRCGVVSAPTIPVLEVTEAQAEAIRNSLESQAPAGGTPIVGALTLAYKHLHEQLAAPGARYVVILTDGADSCDADYEATVGEGDWVEHLITVEIPKALGVGISTFVIGAPGSENARNVLSRMAVAGGTAREGCAAGTTADEGDCHYDMTRGDFEQGLGEALALITEVVTCSVR